MTDANPKASRVQHRTDVLNESLADAPLNERKVNESNDCNKIPVYD